jgi:hypothetical protein
MKFDLKLLSLFVGDAALDVTHIRDAQLTPWQSHPRRPTVVTWSAQWVVGVAVARSHLNASPCQSLHCSETHMGFFASVLAQMFRHQSDQRTRRAAVRLLRRQLNLYDISLRHFYFRLSGKYYSLRLSPVLGVALFRDTLD